MSENYQTQLRIAQVQTDDVTIAANSYGSFSGTLPDDVKLYGIISVGIEGTRAWACTCYYHSQGSSSSFVAYVGNNSTSSSATIHLIVRYLYTLL